MKGWNGYLFRAIDAAMERIGVLIALRKAPETLPPSRFDFNTTIIILTVLTIAEKRNKRPRAPSPSGTPIPVPSITNSRSVSITLPPRTNSVGPTTHTRESRTKKDTSNKQLLPGRKVVFHQPKAADGADSAWILAVVVKYVGPDKHGGKYEVQDAEPQDDGKPGP
jgi:SAGA-associated factor 29